MRENNINIKNILLQIAISAVKLWDINLVPYLNSWIIHKYIHHFFLLTVFKIAIINYKIKKTKQNEYLSKIIIKQTSNLELSILVWNHCYNLHTQFNDSLYKQFLLFKLWLETELKSVNWKRMATDSQRAGLQRWESTEKHNQRERLPSSYVMKVAKWLEQTCHDRTDNIADFIHFLLFYFWTIILKMLNLYYMKKLCVSRYQSIF